jgi:hypothetical protein
MEVVVHRVVWAIVIAFVVLLILLGVVHFEDGSGY